MKAAEIQLLPFLEGKKQFIIPIYQRTYSWTREQCEQLWNDIVRAATDKEVQGHFLGSIVFIQRGLFMAANIPQLLVIDGQQRLSTLSLLLVALAKAAEKSTKPLNISHEDIYDSYLINKHGRGEQRYKLLLTQSDKDTLIQLIDDPDQAKSLKTVSRLLENYLFFEERIRQSNVDPYTLFIGISKLIIVEISLDRDHDNPQLIFESLISTGMDLSQADLIRNYVLMGLDNDEQARLYKSYWYPMEQSFRHTDDPYQFDRFMRDYLTVKQGAIPNIGKVYASFKSYQRSKLATPISEIVADVYRYNFTDRCCQFAPLIAFKAGIYLTNIWNSSLLDSQVVSHESVELIWIICVAEALLHRIPVGFIESCLFVIIKSHQHVVTNQVCLRQVHASRVKAFKDKLGVIVVSIQGNLDDDQFAYAYEQGIGIDIRLAYPFFKEEIVFKEPTYGLQGLCLVRIINKLYERVLVTLRK